MNDLIATVEGEIDGQRQPLCSARALHQYLEVATRFDIWAKRRLDDCRFQPNRDYLVIKFDRQVPHQGGDRAVSQIDYHLPLRTAQHVAMMENSDIGFQVRDYFIEMEKRALAFVPSIGVVRQYGMRHPSALLTPEEKRVLLEARPDWKTIQEMVLQGMNGSEICDKLGQARNTVYSKISRMRMCGILPPDPRRVALKIERAMRALALEQDQ